MDNRRRTNNAESSYIGEALGTAFEHTTVIVVFINPDEVTTYSRATATVKARRDPACHADSA
ncbi:hypothetical protein [Corynebacterium silvaticum]|uniref:Uncharacterized protein n=1 Tax=Corynebacterium silvaticum TaxID=2320431 RepID=A0ACD4PY94_9CORY|nr:hypothetical protein [Corynebacterium silvaticum]MBH5301003.1 hypothetical protein [Corynebacterium silvaticum]NOM65202.1 hypothetical protein [Corynebacterium silvaticum]NON70838.1 hypothetical protein [Corynebacterium silvaticum]TFA92785.1 hypothetical protein EU802_05495 [Corynebacterium silvaticum]TFA96469.1 hypothetical protein EU799_05675 [Corynebacterium silvaticum]